MNNTDRELLEYAAKAAGIDAEYDSWEGMWLKGGRTPDNNCFWNPLADDGDALRLAVKLGISFSDDYLYPNGEHVIRVGCSFGHTLYGDSEMCGDDPYAATRRAITRAAAEIGKNMK